MNEIYIGCMLAVACLVIFAELMNERRSRKKRIFFKQPLLQSELVFRSFLRASIVGIVTIITAVFLFLATTCNFFSLKEGVAVVIDVSGLPEENSLGLEKNIADTLSGQLGEIPLSLYELRGGAVFSVCPPTIDRIFFSLQLGSLSPLGSLRRTAVTMTQIEDQVHKMYATVSPWVVIISANRIASGKGHLKATASIYAGKDGVKYTLYDKSRVLRIGSIDLLVKEIRYRIAQTQKDDHLDRGLMLEISVSLVLAYLLFLFWKTEWTALGNIIICFLTFNAGLLAENATEANTVVQDAADLAEGGMFLESEKKIVDLLQSTSSVDVRVRLLYDRALLSYLQGDSRASLNWIVAVEDLDLDKTMKKNFDTLEGLALIQMLQGYTSTEEYLQRKTALEAYLKRGPVVNQDLIDSANLVLMASRLLVEESIRFTIHWIQNALIASQGQGGAPFYRCAEGITTVTNGIVQDYLKQFFDKETLKTFIIEASSIKNMIDLNRIYLWYYLASAHTVSESIDYIFQMGCTLTNRALYFPFFRKIVDANLPMLDRLLKKIEASLTDSQREIYLRLIKERPATFKMQAVYWYARRVLWPAILEEGKTRDKIVALLLSRERKSGLPYGTQVVLADLAASVLVLKKAPLNCQDPLEFVINEVLNSWYEMDPSGFFQFLLIQQKQEERDWTERLAVFLSRSIKNDQNYSPFCSEIVHRIGNDDIKSFNSHLLGHLWQLGFVNIDAKKRPTLTLDVLEDLLLELHEELVDPNDDTLKTLCLIYQVMPSIEEGLKKSGGYFRGKKRERYDELLYEFSTVTESIQEEIEKPAMFRLPKVREEVLASAAVILQMVRLCSETNMDSSAGSVKTRSEDVPGVLRQENAVTLYQELDQSDRELLGD